MGACVVRAYVRTCVRACVRACEYAGWGDVGPVCVCVHTHYCASQILQHMLGLPVVRCAAGIRDWQQKHGLVDALCCRWQRSVPLTLGTFPNLGHLHIFPFLSHDQYFAWQQHTHGA